MQSILMKAVVPLLLVACLVYVFGQSEPDAADPDVGLASSITIAAPDPTDAVIEIKRNEQPRLRFGGYPCIGECAEHLAGYYWAEENGISEPDNCEGLNAEFIEGCRVYAEERDTLRLALTLD